MAFIAIQCPSCSSTDVTLRGGANYQCNHCNTAFIRNLPPQAPPQAPPPPRQLKVPVNSYGPQAQPTIAPLPVQQAPTVRFRWGWWLFIMLFAFGGPLIGAVVNFMRVGDASQAATKAMNDALEATKTPEVPKAPTQVVPRRPSANLGSGAAPTDEEVEVDAAPEELPVEKGEGTSLDGYQRLQGCSCETGTGNVDLYTRHDGGGTTITSAGTTRTMSLSFALKVGNSTPFTLPVGESTAPASSFEQGRFPLGIGCEDDTVVIATENTLTGWSIEDRSARWSTALPSSFGAVEPSDKPGIDCKSVTVKNGVASVRVGGKTVKASLDSGMPPGGSAKPEPRADKPESKPDPKPEPEPEPEAKPKDSTPAPPKPDPSPEPASDSKKKKKKKKKGKKKK